MGNGWNGDTDRLVVFLFLVGLVMLTILLMIIIL
jgi:hypothetical protein